MLLVGAAGWASAQPNLRAPMDSPLVSKLLDEPFTRPEGEIRAAIEALRFSHNTGEAALLDQAGRRRLGTLLPASIAIAVAASIP